MLEGCEAFHHFIGNLIGQSAGITHKLSFFSHVYIASLDKGNADDLDLTYQGNGWYKLNNWSRLSTQISLKCIDSGNSPQLISGLSDLSGTKIFSIKIVESEGENAVLFQLDWSNPSSTPTAIGSLTYTTAAGGCEGEFTDITYDAVSSTDSTFGFPNGGTSTMVWTTSNFLFSNFTFVLTYESDCNATVTVGLNEQTSGLGNVELTALEGGFMELLTSPQYTIVFVDSNGVRTDINTD